MTVKRKPQCVVLGSGGHAAMVVEAIQSAEAIELVGILDSNVSRIGQQVLGITVIGNDAMLGDLAERGVRFFAVGVGGTGDNGPRSSIFQAALDRGLTPLTVVHPSAIVSTGATIGAGAQVLPGAIVNTGAVIGRNVIINSGAIVEHDCSVGDHVHVAPGATLAGAVRVADRAHIGLGAAVLQRLAIGASSIVAAGAVVVKDVPDRVVVAGVPARIVRSVDVSE